MRYYIIAGERSGDLHGSNLVKAIKKLDADAVFRGFGGNYMKENGVELAVHYEQMAFMGFVTLLANYGTIRRMLKFCKDDILKFKPDVVILIDYGGFNRRIAKFVKPRGVKTFYYIPPKIWAWYQSRAKEIKANVDRLFVILPFEKDFYKKYDWEVDYVGNPVLDAVKVFQPDKNFRSKHSFSSNNKPIVALLPGSRKQELHRMFKIMLAFKDNFKEYELVIAGTSNIPQKLYKKAIDKGFKVVMDQTYELMQYAKAGVIKSGTSTLEAALFELPEVVCYRSGRLTILIAKQLVSKNLKYISLVNLIMDKEIVKELIQQEMTAKNISEELNKLLNNKSHRETIISEYKELKTKLGGVGASKRLAQAIHSDLMNSK